MIREALAHLGVRRLVLAIHAPSLPADPFEDTGRGVLYSSAGADFLRFAARLGFDGLQLGPQGQTSAGNASPYDSALFSRELMDVSLRPLVEDPSWGHLLTRERLAALVANTPPHTARHADHRASMAARRTALAEARQAFVLGSSPAIRARQRELAAWRDANAHWLEPDGTYEALIAEHGTEDWSTWADARPDPARLAALRARHADVVEQHAFVQFLIDGQHRGFRGLASAAGLRLYGDLQIGVSHRDRWTHAPRFLSGYVMGAPPSRTNPEGQPWGYPVLDPDQYLEADGSPGAAQRFVAARLARMLEQFDGVRIDHPHGIVTPWVYRADDPDPLHAVQNGARLFSSPDLPDHPGLARYALLPPEQVNRHAQRYADEWERFLTPAQVDRYETLLRVVLEQARAHGREESDVLCEVLSTWPRPLRAVMERHRLGRFYVTQKADPDDRYDVYRSANATAADWTMIGNHDTPTVWSLARDWQGTPRATSWARYLAERLTPPGGDHAAFAARVAASPGALAEAMLADLLVGPARHVSLFFADLLGLEERYNAPGTVGDHNWSLRVPPDYQLAYPTRVREGRALSPARAAAVALRARGDADSLALSRRLA